MTTAIIGGIIGGLLGNLAYTAAQTNTAQRLKCRLTGHNWIKYGYIEHDCPKHGTERAHIDICTRCGTKNVYGPNNTPIRTTPEE